MTQALYAHMNNKIKKKEILFKFWFLSILVIYKYSIALFEHSCLYSVQTTVPFLKKVPIVQCWYRIKDRVEKKRVRIGFHCEENEQSEIIRRDLGQTLLNMRCQEMCLIKLLKSSTYMYMVIPIILFTYA
jgi:hypothetical protein